MNEQPPDPTLCPLCDRENDCQLCSPAAYKGQCWCASVKFPDALLEQIPPEFRNKACLCRDCVTQFHQQAGKTAPAPKILPDDFYFDASGLMVFTAAYHLRRGYCCGSHCRHCPYPPTKNAVSPSPGGPRFAKRTSFMGKLTGGGLGKPLGRGEGGL